MSADLERSLRAILEDQSEDKPIKICHIRDIESFFFNGEDKKKKMCRFYQRGECSKRNCPYSHDKNMMRMQRFKVELCKNYEETGTCKFKDSCTYAHGRSELRYKWWWLYEFMLSLILASTMFLAWIRLISEAQSGGSRIINLWECSYEGWYNFLLG